jgi:hypothetical protein
LLALLLASQAIAQTTSSWTPFTSKEGGFMVLLPGIPVETTIPALAGGKSAGGRSFQVVRPGWGITICYHDLLVSTGSPADCLKTLDDSLMLTCKQPNARLLQKRSCSLGQYPGLECVVQQGDCVHARMRAVVAQGRIFMITLDGLKEHVTSADADAFFDSFKLTGPLPPPVSPPPPKPLDFRPFTSREGKYTVLLPGTPEEKHPVVATPFGQARGFSVEVEAGNLSWLVYVLDYPVAFPDPQLMLANIANELAAKLKGSIVSKKVLSSKEPGCEVLIEGPSPSPARCRIYLINKRVYGLLVMGNSGEIKSPEVERFFGSFKVLK